MKASLLFYKPFLLPVGTRLTLLCGDAYETVFFAGYKVYEGYLIDRYDIYPKFKKANKQGEMSTRNAELFPSFYFSTSTNIELHIDPEEFKGIARTYVEREYDRFFEFECDGRKVRRIAKTICPTTWTEDGVERSVETILLVVPEHGSQAPVIVVAEVKHKGGDGITYAEEVPVETLPTIVQENILLRLYDAAEGRKQGKDEASKILRGIF